MLGRASKMKVPFAAFFFFCTTSRVASSNAINAWKIKGGLGSEENSMFKTWEAHDTELHSFLKETIPEALAHTGQLSQRITFG